VGVEQTVGCFLFLNLRGLISAAVRLGIVGPIEAQTLQLELSADAPKWVARALSCKDAETEVAQTSPLLDFYQALQDQLYSRLFVS
jgi:urease accessory protein